ncbi:MAG: hypothetical protein Fues2KO_41240 [Fuerstiella sp.]
MGNPAEGYCGPIADAERLHHGIPHMPAGTDIASVSSLQLTSQNSANEVRRVGFTVSPETETWTDQSRLQNIDGTMS